MHDSLMIIITLRTVSSLGKRWVRTKDLHEWEGQITTKLQVIRIPLLILKLRATVTDIKPAFCIIPFMWFHISTKLHNKTC